MRDVKGGVTEKGLDTQTRGTVREGRWEGGWNREGVRGKVVDRWRNANASSLSLGRGLIHTL